MTPCLSCERGWAKMGAKLLLENEQRLAKRQWEKQQWSKEDWQQWNRGLWGLARPRTLLVLFDLWGKPGGWWCRHFACSSGLSRFSGSRSSHLGWTTTHGRDRAGLGIRSRARTIGGAPRQRVIMLTPPSWAGWGHYRLWRKALLRWDGNTDVAQYRRSEKILKSLEWETSGEVGNT